jgi:hypothetical protein
MNSADDSGLTNEVAPKAQPATIEAAPAKKERSQLSDAVLPLVGVLLGGLLAAGASLFTAHMEAKAQERQAIEQYRRDNRETIYSAMLAQVSVMQNVMNQVEVQTAMSSSRKPLNAPAQTPEDDADIYNRLNEQFQPAFDKLSTAISDAELVGSHRVIELSKALQDSYFVTFTKLAVPTDVAVKLGSGYKALQPAQPTPADQDPNAPEAADNVANLDQLPPAQLKELLVAAAKEDLAFND